MRQRAYIYIASLPAAGRGSFGRSRAEIDRDARARIEPRRNALRSALRVKLMRVFADLADADLREYVEFAESRASIAFNQSYMWSYSEAFESRMREFGDVMMLNTGAVFR